MSRALPEDCAGCTFRRTTEEGSALMCGIKHHRCVEFISSETGPLDCDYAHATFCRGGDFKRRTIRQRIVDFITA